MAQKAPALHFPSQDGHGRTGGRTLFYSNTRPTHLHFPLRQRICENPWAECSARTNTWHSAIFPLSVPAARSHLSQSVCLGRGRQASRRPSFSHARHCQFWHGCNPPLQRSCRRRTRSPDQSRRAANVVADISLSYRLKEGREGNITQLG